MTLDIRLAKSLSFFSQLIDAVNAHTHVLKDLLSLIRQLENSVLLTGKEYSSDMGRRCSTLPFDSH
jgi:hypothetical protein